VKGLKTGKDSMSIVKYKDICFIKEKISFQKKKKTLMQKKNLLVNIAVSSLNLKYMINCFNAWS
jgi:hypothetical protein